MRASAFGGDRLELGLPDSIVLDAVVVGSGRGEPHLVRGELLEGVTLDSSPVFDAWLLVERRRLAGVSEGLQRDAALSALAASRPGDAAGLALRA